MRVESRWHTTWSVVVFWRISHLHPVDRRSACSKVLHTFCMQALKRRMRRTLLESLKRRWASKMLLLRSYLTFGMAMRRAGCGGDYSGVSNLRSLHESTFKLR